MEALRATDEEIDQVNMQRKMVACASFLYLAGSCSADSNRLATGELATVMHLEDMADTAKSVSNIEFVARYVGEKPRTQVGPTGLIHKVGGPEIYIEGVRELHGKGIPLGSEVMDETAYAIAGQHQSLAWIGARNVDDTGPRHLVRPTSEDIDRGIHPLKTYVKCGQDGGLDGTINALRTIMSEAPETRTRLTSKGLMTIATYGNPHVGVILRGNRNRPEGPLDEILTDEIGVAREMLDAEFGENVVAIVIDLSHAHAKGEGGGEEGQVKVGQAVSRLLLKGIKIDGVTAETYILPGNQPGDGTIPGLSTTDECVGQAKAQAQMLDIDRACTDSLKIAGLQYSGITKV